jgi:hypothetical protein
MTRILTRFEAELRAPFYLVVADYSEMPGLRFVMGSGDPVGDAEDAADRFADHIDKCRDARVIKIDLQAGTVTDAAAEIHAIIRQRCRERGIAAE